MRRQLETRLQHLEEEAKRKSKALEQEFCDSLYRCLGSWELDRLYAARQASEGGQWSPEGLMILELAWTRKIGGWTHADSAAQDKQFRDKKTALWDLARAVGALSDRCYLDTYRLDANDVSEAEIKQLVEIAAKATCASDLEPVAQIVSRLRLDGHVMEMAEFEALVLRKEIAPPPPPEMPGYRTRLSNPPASLK